MSVAQMQWDDLRIVLALGRAGTLAGAAQALGLDRSTVFRRIGALEAALGVRLFERLGGAWRPTAAGEAATRAAERIEEEALALGRDLAGRDARLVGRLRVTASETLAFRLLMRCIAAFRRAHPGITVELTIENRLLSLSKREADVALRATRPTQGDLFGRRIGTIAWTAYAARSYAQAHGLPRAPGELGLHALIGWDDPSVQVRAAEWLAANAPESAVVYRSNSLVNQLMAAREGIGIAILPCYLGDPEPDLVRAFAPLAELTPELWLVTHADLKRTARVRAFFDIVGEGLTRERRLLEGGGPQPSS